MISTLAKKKKKKIEICINNTVKNQETNQLVKLSCIINMKI